MYKEFGPGVPLRIDPNSAWTVDTSVRSRKGTSARNFPVVVIWKIQRPVLLAWLKYGRDCLQSGINVPLASNVAVTSFSDIPASVAPMLCRSFYATIIIGAECDRFNIWRNWQKHFNIGLSMHSNSHLGISLMAMAHVAAATPHLTYACDTHYPWQSEKDEVVLGGKDQNKRWMRKIPDKPGLGRFDLDYDQLERGKERYKNVPYKKRDDETEMRKHVDPTGKEFFRDGKFESDRYRYENIKRRSIPDVLPDAGRD